MAKHGASIETTVFVGNEAKDVECATRTGVTSMLPLTLSVKTSLGKTTGSKSCLT